jgi:hypothetical protein
MAPVPHAQKRQFPWYNTVKDVVISNGHEIVCFVQA